MAVAPEETDLSAAALRRVMPERPMRVYPALVSTESDAQAWARAGGPEGAVVVADYQASPRGRAGLIWRPEPGRSLAFSMVLRPRLPVEREGWLYTVATSGLADTLGDEATIEWPDEVWTPSEPERPAGAVGVQVQLGPAGTEWAVVNVLVSTAPPSRAPLLAAVVEGIEQRYRSPVPSVLADYMPRCRTLGRTVRARLIPLGPGGPEVTGRAADSLGDGALVLETAMGRRVAVRPQHLGVLEQIS